MRSFIKKFYKQKSWPWGVERTEEKCQNAFRCERVVALVSDEWEDHVCSG